MIDEDAKQEIRDRYEALSSAVPNFRKRSGQRVMIAEIAKAFARCPDAGTPAPGSTILCVQGGTGLGKSLSYVLSGSVMARRKKKRFVISSATVALQEQLIKKDLPMFLKAGGLDLKVEIAKGRTRYVCAYRLNQVIGDLKQTTMFGKEARGRDNPGEEMTRAAEAMQKDFVEGRWDGDRDLRPGIDDALWRSVTTDRHGCLSRNCPSFRSCAQFAARKRLKEADIIVANHDLVLADLAMSGGKILPKPEETFYAFDEAHHLPEKAVSAFASSHMVHAAQRMMDKIAAMTSGLEQAFGPSYKGEADRIAAVADRVGEALGHAHGFFESLVQLRPTPASPRPTLDFQMSCVPEEFFGIGANVANGTDDLIKKLAPAAEQLAALMGSGDKAKQALVEKLSADVGFYLGRLEEIQTTWALFMEEPALDQPPVAKWVETVQQKQGLDYQMSASPVMAGGYLRCLLWDKAAGAVLTSATLKTLDSFDNFFRRSGLGAYEQVTNIELPSPFDYAQQGTIEIVKMRASPKNYEVHTAEVTERLGTLIDLKKAEGTLVLFTSRRQMEDVAGRLPQDLRDRILVQGSGSKTTIITEHKRRIDSGQASAIFGLDSFSEGVDLAGKYCTHVVIAKLPFAVPDDPVLKTLSDWIKRRGGEPFMEIVVPDAARKLEQGVGRLIRTETDRGLITVLDPRLWAHNYGRLILRGLPPFRIIAMGKEVSL